MFSVFYSFVVMQRLLELRIAKKNERWMRNNGAFEFGEEHYPLMVCMHMAFLLSFLLEVIFFQKTISQLWPVLLPLFISTQILRVWAIRSLGRYWNTKILIVPNAKIVQSGPYRFIRHPNYLIVCLEILLIPLMFQAYLTGAAFTLLNAWILSVRIPIEEQALSNVTSDYSDYVEDKSRFSPSLPKNIN